MWAGLEHAIRGWVRRNRVLRDLVRRRRARTWLVPWRDLPDAHLLDQAPGPARAVRVLLATNVGGYLNGSIPEAALGAALRLRGHEVDMLLCDGLLPACMECTYVQISPEQMARGGPQSSLCGFCHATGVRSVEGLGIGIHSFSENLTEQERAEARAIAAAASPEDVQDLEVDGLRVGEHALAGALRFFARSTLEGEERALPVLRRYVEAAVITARVVQRLLRTQQYDVAVFHHGIYVPQGIAGEVCRAEGVRVVNWNPGYRDGTFIFSHVDTYHHTMMEEPTETWESQGWDDEREEVVLDYLASRWTGARDWIYFQREPQQDVSAIEQELGIDFSAKPTVGLLTNVMWDAQLHYPANAFDTMLEWMLTTIRYFAADPSRQLVIRVHPAEHTGWLPTRQLVVDEIRKAFPTLPENVFVIGPESRASTYAAMLECDSVIIYGTKTGVELTSLGVPVVVAGEAWIRGKGVTADVESKEHYQQVLDSLPRGERMSPEQTRRARQYAYHFFFRRMIPLEFMRATGTAIPVYHADLQHLETLQPGRSLGLDIVIDGITTGSPFVYPADSVAHSAQAAP